MDKAREVALKALVEIEAKESYSNLLLKKVLRNDALDTRDKAFITELVYGTISRKITLDWVISQFSKTKVTKLSQWVLQLLRMGIYQILFLDKVPPSAACNTAVDLAKKYAKASSGFVNAILRNVVRSKETLDVHHIKAGSVVKNLSIRYSFPEYLTAQWLSDFGKDFTERLLASLLERPDFSVRVNTLRSNREEIIEELIRTGVQVTDGRFLPEALVLKNISDISCIEAFLQGKITVQDESSMLVTTILDPQPGERVLDVCAAPGGKTTHIGQRMENNGHITAWDIHEHKTHLIQENASRLGITIIKTQQWDAMQLHEEAVDQYHRVLVDAPCSGTGIIRRKPDIKWQRKQDDFGSLVEVQRKILYNASRYVLPGGILVYSTCSLDNRENTQVIEQFLKENSSSFEAAALNDVLPEPLADNADKQLGSLSLYPHIDGTDGFFIAKLQKKQRINS